MKSSLSQTPRGLLVIPDNFVLNDLNDHHAIQSPSSCCVSTRRVNKKRVSFDERVQVRTTIACHDMSKEEINAVWYSPEEYLQITESCCKQIIKLNHGETLKDRKYCARGLESLTHVQSLGKSLNRSLAHKVVFDEQGRQWQNGIHNDVEALSRVYLAASSESCLWANLIGLHDQKQADNIYDEPSSSY